MATGYLLLKTMHLVFVMAFMGCVFYLPRILVNLAEAGEEPAVRARLQVMGRRLLRFGHMMFGIMVLLGLGLWLHYGMSGGWLHAKLCLVAAMFAYYLWIGRLLKRSEAGAALPSATALRWINELPVLVLIGIVWLVIAKPF